MTVFVCEKSELIYQEFSNMLLRGAAAWASLEETFAHAVKPDHIDVAAWKATAVETSLGIAADYKMRFLRRSRGFPHSILWAVNRAHDVDDPNRAEMFSELVSGSVDEAFSLKLCGLFKPEFEAASRTGKLCQKLWQLLDDLSRVWYTDTQVVEGVMNTIKSVNHAAPSIRWPLLMARVLVKTNIGARYRNLDIKSREAVLEQMSSTHMEACAFRDSAEFRHVCAGRFDVDAWPLCRIMGPTKYVNNTMLPGSDRSQVCAAWLLKELKAALHVEFDVSAKFALSIVPDVLKPGSEYDVSSAWLFSFKYYTNMWVTRGTLLDDGCFHLTLPLDQRPLLYVLLEGHDEWDSGNVDMCLDTLAWDVDGSYDVASVTGRTIIKSFTECKCAAACVGADACVEAVDMWRDAAAGPDTEKPDDDDVGGDDAALEHAGDEQERCALDEAVRRRLFADSDDPAALEQRRAALIEHVDAEDLLEGAAGSRSDDMSDHCEEADAGDADMMLCIPPWEAQVVELLCAHLRFNEPVYRRAQEKFMSLMQWTGKGDEECDISDVRTVWVHWDDVCPSWQGRLPPVSSAGSAGY